MLNSGAKVSKKKTKSFLHLTKTDFAFAKKQPFTFVFV